MKHRGLKQRLQVGETNFQKKREILYHLVSSDQDWGPFWRRCVSQLQLTGLYSRGTLLLMQRSDWSASLLFLMSLAGQATIPLGKSYGVERRKR